ncbi:hypothetical protein AM228_07310 [Planktothricoides sp. SR001]|nr:hypothetical protein AM228_07310 [Planktothricoides sp. SR001]
MGRHRCGGTGKRKEERGKRKEERGKRKILCISLLCISLPPTPYTLHPTRRRLPPTPYTLHPTPCCLMSSIVLNSRRF